MIKRSGTLTQSQALTEIYAKNRDIGTSISQVEATILTLVSQSNQDRISYYKLLHEFESYYLCSAIYEILVDEILKDSGTKVLIKITSSKYQDHCNNAMANFNLDHLVENMLPKLLHYGDYTYRINRAPATADGKPGKITGISDDYYPGDVMGIYNNMVPISYYELPQVRAIRMSSKSRAQSIFHEAKKLGIGDVLHFTLQSDSIKLELDDTLKDKFSTPTLTVGIGVLWPLIDRLLLLKLREIGTTASDLSRLTRPTLIGADVPASDSAKKILEYCGDLEKILNSSTSDLVGGTADFITSITAAMSNSYKVIPKFSSGRGDASKLNLETQLNDHNDDQKLSDERTLICSLAGIPPELVLSAGQTERSNQRIYARMNKKVKKIQRSISRSIKHFMVNYVNSETGDLEVSENDFEVVLNSSTNIEDIDDAESLGYIIDNISNIIEAVDKVKTSGILGNDRVSPIDPKRFMDYLRSEFQSSGSKASGIWRTSEELDKARIEAKSNPDPDPLGSSSDDYPPDPEPLGSSDDDNPQELTQDDTPPDLYPELDPETDVSLDVSPDKSDSE